MRYYPWIRGWYRRKVFKATTKKWGKTPKAYRRYHLLMTIGCGTIGKLYHLLKYLQWAIKKK